MSNGNIETTTINLRTFIVAIIFTISVTVSGTITYMSLVHASSEIEYTNERIDKKTARNADAIDEIEARLTELEKEISKNPP